jgi:hypothetical protein
VVAMCIHSICVALSTSCSAHTGPGGDGCSGRVGGREVSDTPPDAAGSKTARPAATVATGWLLPASAAPALLLVLPGAATGIGAKVRGLRARTRACTAERVQRASWSL